MALIKCKECGQEISDTITVCPKCGYHMEKGISNEIKEMEKIVTGAKLFGRTNIVIGVFFLLITVGGLIGYAYGSGFIDTKIGKLETKINEVNDKSKFGVAEEFITLVKYGKSLVLSSIVVLGCFSLMCISNGVLFLSSAKGITSITERIRAGDTHQDG